MSIANLLVANDYNVFANSLTLTQAIVQPSTYRIDRSFLNQRLITATITPVMYEQTLNNSNFPAPSGGNTIYTIPKTGLYEISYALTISKNNGQGQVFAWIQPSGTTIRYGLSGSNQFEASVLTPGPPVSAITLGLDNDYLTGSTLLAMTSGQTFTIDAFQNSGADRVIVSDGANNQPYVSVKYVGSQ